jgi:hypothetical protein
MGICISANLFIPFEDSRGGEQITALHKILDCMSDTDTAEMRSGYKIGFKDSMALMMEIK